MPLWSHIVQNSWFRFCIAALLSSWTLLFVFLAVDEVLKINVLLPLTRVFHQFTEVFWLLVPQPAVFLSVVVRLPQFSEEFSGSLSCSQGFRRFNFDRTLYLSLNSPKSFQFLIHKRWCEYSLYSFSRHRVPENLILLSWRARRFC
jgi:hypothetical protein